MFFKRKKYRRFKNFPLYFRLAFDKYEIKKPNQIVKITSPLFGEKSILDICNEKGDDGIWSVIMMLPRVIGVA